MDLGPVLVASKVMVAAAAQSLARATTKLSLGQLRVLVVLHERGPMNLSGLADVLGVSNSSASRTCDRLVDADMIVRTENSQDRRHVDLSLSATARRLVERALKERRQLFEQIIAEMSPTAARQLLSVLPAFTRASAEVLDPESTNTYLLG